MKAPHLNLKQYLQAAVRGALLIMILFAAGNNTYAQNEPPGEYILIHQVGAHDGIAYFTYIYCDTSTYTIEDILHYFIPVDTSTFEKLRNCTYDYCNKVGQKGKTYPDSCVFCFQVNMMSDDREVYWYYLRTDEETKEQFIKLLEILPDTESYVRVRKYLSGVIRNINDSAKEHDATLKD